jgi:hypothetical protein
MLLRIASGDEAATAEGAQLSGRSGEIVHEAAAFFIEQILLFPGASSYRVLGASQNATAGELRRNMALLLTWLHPDVDRSGERSIFAGRVTGAWEDLKTPNAAQPMTRYNSRWAKGKHVAETRQTQSTPGVRRSRAPPHLTRKEILVPGGRNTRDFCGASCCCCLVGRYVDGWQTLVATCWVFGARASHRA